MILSTAFPFHYVYFDIQVLCLTVCEFVCLCVCVYMYVHVYVFVCICVSACVCVCIRVYKRVRVCKREKGCANATLQTKTQTHPIINSQNFILKLINLISVTMYSNAGLMRKKSTEDIKYSSKQYMFVCISIVF